MPGQLRLRGLPMMGRHICFDYKKKWCEKSDSFCGGFSTTLGSYSLKANSSVKILSGRKRIFKHRGWGDGCAGGECVFEAGGRFVVMQLFWDGSLVNFPSCESGGPGYTEATKSPQFSEVEHKSVCVVLKLRLWSALIPSGAPGPWSRFPPGHPKPPGQREKKPIDGFWSAHSEATPFTSVRVYWSKRVTGPRRTPRDGGWEQGMVLPGTLGVNPDRCCSFLESGHRDAGFRTLFILDSRCPLKAPQSQGISAEDQWALLWKERQWHVKNNTVNLVLFPIKWGMAIRVFF